MLAAQQVKSGKIMSLEEEKAMFGPESPVHRLLLPVDTLQELIKKKIGQFLAGELKQPVKPVVVVKPAAEGAEVTASIKVTVMQ